MIIVWRDPFSAEENKLWDDRLWEESQSKLTTINLWIQEPLSLFSYNILESFSGNQSLEIDKIMLSVWDFVISLTFFKLSYLTSYASLCFSVPVLESALTSLSPFYYSQTTSVNPCIHTHFESRIFCYAVHLMLLHAGYQFLKYKYPDSVIIIKACWQGGFSWLSLSLSLSLSPSVSIIHRSWYILSVASNVYTKQLFQLWNVYM